LHQRKLYTYRFALIWALVILFACGSSPGTLAELKLEDLFAYDKPIHALLFGIQAWLLIKANSSTQTLTKKMVWQWCVISALFGAFIELLQKWVFVGRSYDYFDMLANTFGCLIVLIIFLNKTSKSKVITP
jgi:VanZ family protein